jgi:peptidoglycan glycosyltransferase
VPALAQLRSTGRHVIIHRASMPATSSFSAATGAGRSRRPPSRRRGSRLPLPPAVLAAAAAVAFLAGLVAGAGSGDDTREAAARFAAAWARQDYAAMHAELGPAARRRTSPQRLLRTYRRAAEIMTLESVRTGPASEPRDGVVTIPVALRTRIFGTLRGRLAVRMEEPGEGDPGVDWRAQYVVFGLRPGEQLSRRTRLPPRATIEARDGTPIAKGEARLSELGPLASEIAGRVGPGPPEQAEALLAAGVPPGAPVGLTGLEREFDARLRGVPGGTLLAGRRVLAHSAPRPGAPVRTTIDPRVQRAAVEALAGRFGGIAVVRPRDGEVLALAGIAFSAPQPPGSTFKIVTLAGALAARVVKRSERFPVQTATTLAGVELENAHGEACGGSLEASFAESCNSVFAPLGARLGARRLVRAAERFGFNEAPGLAGAARSTIPAAEEIGDELAVGSTAIGQGKVLATPLLLATIAAAIGERGLRPRPTLLKGARPGPVRATSPAIARTIARYMRTVVRSGTGVGAAIPGVAVAGKTGTAELRSTVNEDPVPPEEGEPPPEDDKTDTDAWFAAFAPAGRPRLAVAVLLVGQGAGGETAAPAARHVLQAGRALARRRGRRPPRRCPGCR